MLASFTRKWAGAALRVSRSSSQRRRAVGTGCLAIVCCLALAYCLARVISAPPAHGAPNDVPPFPRNPTIPTEVVIIGTRHSAQLEYEDHAPAWIRALLNRIGPAAVGVETPPRWFERDVYYEIAYESYGVGVPWAEEKGKEVRPIDWQARGIEFINALAWPDVEPPVELEIETGFEAEVEPGGEPGVEPEVDIPLELWDMRDFFFADTPEWRDLVNREYAYATPDPNPWNEAVRRYMLYRNLMIAREIVNLAADYEGQRVVVLIGAAHKPDLDLLLESVPNIVVRHASEWSGVSDAEVAAEERRRDHLAILWFNLAGSLVDPSDVDLDRMDDLLAKVEREAPDDPEVGFLRARRHAIAGRLPKRWRSTATLHGTLSGRTGLSHTRIVLLPSG